MKLKQGLLIHDTRDGTVAVATGKAAEQFSGMIRLSPTAAFILRAMEKETTEDEIVSAMTATYDVDEATARADAKAVIEKLRAAHLLEE